MLSFATEFPVKKLANKAEFVGHIVSWIRGTSYSSLFDDPETAYLESDIVNIKSKNGESISIREFQKDDNFQAVGFRYEYNDEDGRLWRTEVVIKNTDLNFDIIRFRTQCIAATPGAKLETPRKPYLIKSILQDGWSVADGALTTSENAIILDENEIGLSIAEAIMNGTASHFLPVIYISATSSQKWLLSNDQISKLAFDLGGVAHVVLEPSRSFSFKLRDIVSGKNCYGGALGFCLPYRGITRKIFDRQYQSNEIAREARISAIDIRSQMPSEGWDWSELQEQAFRNQRQRDRNRLSFSETEALYEDEINSLREKIAQLETEAKERLSEKIDKIIDNDLFLDDIKSIKQIYDGEIFDRIRYISAIAFEKAEQLGLDKRTINMLSELKSKTNYSSDLDELREDLKRFTRDPSRFADEVSSLLSRHGYDVKSENRHLRLEHKDGYIGLDNITLVKTPGDIRGLKNARKQIERALGIAQM